MATPSRPTKVRFLGLSYRIEYVEQVTNDDGVPCTDLGNFDDDAQVVQIKDGQPAEGESRALVHEITHMMLHSCGSKISPKTEERICLFLEKALLAFVKDNPTFWRYVTRKIPDAAPPTIPKG